MESWGLFNRKTGKIQVVDSISQMQIAPDEIDMWNMVDNRFTLYRSGQQPETWPQLSTGQNCSMIDFRWGEDHYLCSDGNDLLRINREGNVINLTNTPSLQEYYLERSPDGTQIAYQAFDPITKTTSLYIMWSDGSNVRRLTHPTNDHVPPVFMVSSGDDIFPHWSPDGQYIAFERHRGYKGLVSKIFVIKSDGTGLRYIDNGTYPAWRPLEGQNG